MHEVFGKRLREERKKQGITVQTLAKACGISRSYITLMENGKRLPGKKIIPIISGALHLKTTDVLNWYLEDIGAQIQQMQQLQKEEDEL